MNLQSPALSSQRSASGLTQAESAQEPEPTSYPALELPTISIVVPNYNGDATLEATLQSLIEQNYPNLEIIVVDGGSTDQSVTIIQNYAPYLKWWVSEPDQGQSNAINKGFAHCTGEIVNWLCSDDRLAPHALEAIGRCFAASPDVDVIVGRSRVEYLTGNNPIQPLLSAGKWTGFLQRFLPIGTMFQEASESHVHLRVPSLDQIALMPAIYPIHQPSCFYRRRLLDRPQPVDESYHYTMDIELFNYFHSRGVRWQIVDEVLSIAPVSGANKSSVAGWKAIDELERIYQTYCHERIPLTFWQRHFRYPLERFLKLHRESYWFYLVAPLWVLITVMLAPFYGLKRVWALRWTGWI